MSSFQASSTLYSPEYYKSGHSVDQNMYIVNTSTHHTNNSYRSMHNPHALTPTQIHKREQEEHFKHEEQVRKRHAKMIHDHGNKHGHDSWT